jgi:triosephosphate isomerase
MKIIAGNFKTNHTRKSTKEFISSLDGIELEDDKVFVFPTSTSLDSFDNTKVNIGVQNAYPTTSGSYTGEIGTSQLDEFGIKTILIGHSERRHILEESQKLIAQKYSFFKELGYKIFYCIGEPLEVKEQGLDATLEYIWEQFDGIDTDYDNLILAYEPVWAIGTGVSATTDDIEQVHDAIKSRFDKPLLYGGSVKPTNLKEILDISNVDGGLIGTASWEAESFKQMIEIAKSY